MSTERVKCLIIGSGPAGYTAAIYTGRANISPVLYEGIQPGGQLTITTEVENFPGYPEGISGTQLMDDLRAQAERFGVEIRTGIITKVDFSERPYKLTIDDEKEIEAETVIISTVHQPSTSAWTTKRNMPVWVSVPVPLATVSSTARRW